MKLSSYFVMSLLVIALLPNVLSSALADTTLPINPNWHALGGSATIPNNADYVMDPLGNDDLPVASGESSPDTVFIVTPPSHGTVTFNSVSTLVTYHPDPFFASPPNVSFQYRDCSSVECSDIGTFTFTITGGSNQPPVADPGSFSVNEDSSKSVKVNGTDPNGDTWWITSFEGAQHGNVVLDITDPTNKTLMYTPTAGTNYVGPDSFTFVLSDGHQHGNPATIDVTIKPVNHPPTASDQSVTVSENIPQSIVLSASHSDPGPLTYIILTSPTHGSLSGTAPNLVYAPATNYFGTDSFTWKASDGISDSNTATVSISVQHVYQPTVAVPDSFTVNQYSSNHLNVTANDNSIDITQGFPVHFSIGHTTPPSHGTIAINPNQTIQYTPTSTFFGSDSFTYTSNLSGTGGVVPGTESLPVTVSLSINRVLLPPVITTPSQYTNNVHQTIEGTADPSVQVNLYDGISQITPAVTSDSSGHWSYSVTLSEGEHVFTAKQTGVTGVPDSPLSNPVTITVITTIPTLSSVHIQSSNTNHALAKPGDTITLTFTSSTTIQTPTVTIAGHAVTATTSGGNNWSAQYIMTSSDSAGLVPFTINFQDLAGNIGAAVTGTSDSSSVSFDKTNPTISIVDPADTSSITAIHVKINGTADDTGSGLQKVEVSLDGGSFAPAIVTPGSPSHWTITVNPSTGTHTITAMATDNAGNVQTTSSSFTITVPTPPTLSSVHIQSSNTNHALAKPGDTITLTFTSSTTIQTPTVTIAGHAVTATTSGGNNWSAQYIMTSSDSAGLVPFTINFQDLYGGSGSQVSSTSDSSSVSFDKTNPTVAITQPANNAIIHIGTLKINGTADDTGSGLQKVEVSLDGGSFAPAIVTPGSPSHWAITTSPSLGLHTIVARATDNAGNVQTTSISINVVNNTPGKVTGGGGVGDTKFAFEVKSKDGISFKGNLEFKDKTNHLDLKSTSITSLFVDTTGTQATFSGTAKVNGHAGYTFKVYIEDHGEPGRNDVFSIQIFDSHANLVDSVSGTLSRGNIVIHNQGNSGDDRDDDDHDFREAIKLRDS